MAVAVAAYPPFLGQSSFHLVRAAYPPFMGQSSFHPRKISSRRRIQNSNIGFSIKAIFWGPRKAVEPTKQELSLGDFTLTELGFEGDRTNFDKGRKLSVRVVSSISAISSDQWDACSLDAAGREKFNPFLTHGFLSSLEESGCAVKETGWVPQHIIAQDESDSVLGVIPLYLKSHSYGEYVFDHSWADAYYSYGSRYYPKLQCCVPFTPVTGQRILVRNTNYRDQVFDILVSALVALTIKFQVSSVHITFPSANEWMKLKEKGFLQRTGMQYHWKNRNYRRIKGTTAVDIISGLDWYLKYWCGAHVPWHKTGGAQLGSIPTPGSLPHAGDEGVMVQCSVPWNYYQDVVTSSYSNVWWDWERWEKEIIWTALQGINLALAFRGQEAIWEKVFAVSLISLRSIQMISLVDLRSLLGHVWATYMDGMGRRLRIGYIHS